MEEKAGKITDLDELDVRKLLVYIGLYYIFHNNVKSSDSTTGFRIWQFQTPA
jgi:hypothetical protein